MEKDNIKKELLAEKTVSGRLKRKLRGKVVSDKMDKTVVVNVKITKTHPLYKKRYNVHKKYKAHDEKNECKVGDEVLIKECRPVSKDKRWRVIKKS